MVNYSFEVTKTAGNKFDKKQEQQQQQQILQLQKQF